MKSLSRIIKGNELQIFEPRLVQLGDIVEMKNNKQAPIDDAYEQGSETVQEIEEETARILAETEQMIIDLLQKARTEAREILETAEDEADLIRTRVRDETINIREKAFQEGYEEGIRAAREAMEAERLQASQQSQQLLEEAHATKLKMFHSCEADMLKLSLAVAKRVIAAELVSNDQVVAGILQEALAYVDKPENITLYVNQQDVEKVLELMENNTLSDMGNKANIDVQIDNRISPGGIRLDSEAGSVDARLETRIANVQRAFQEVLLDE